MKSLWERLSARINAMALRERFLLFVALVTVLAVLTNELFVAPLNRLQKQRAAQFENRSAAIEEQMARMEVDLVKSRRARVAELEAEIARVEGDIEAVEREIASVVSSASDIAALRNASTRALRRADKVTLLRITSAESSSAPAAGATPTPPLGLDITLGGGYLDLMEYLSALESALPQARWGSLRFTAETVPPQVAVRIVTPRVGP